MSSSSLALQAFQDTTDMTPSMTKLGIECIIGTAGLFLIYIAVRFVWVSLKGLSTWADGTESNVEVLMNTLFGGCATNPDCANDYKKEEECVRRWQCKWNKDIGSCVNTDDAPKNTTTAGNAFGHCGFVWLGLGAFAYFLLSWKAFRERVSRGAKFVGEKVGGRFKAFFEWVSMKLGWDKMTVKEKMAVTGEWDALHDDIELLHSQGVITAEERDRAHSNNEKARQEREAIDARVQQDLAINAVSLASEGRIEKAEGGHPRRENVVEVEMAELHFK